MSYVEGQPNHTVVISDEEDEELEEVVVAV